MTPHPKPDLATHGRLIACVAALSSLALCEVLRARDGLAGLIFHALTFPFLVWLAWAGVYRSPQLHRLWGWVSLIASGIGLVIVGAHWVRTGELSPPQHQLSILKFLPLPILAYLLLFDRRVAAFRRQLAESQRALTP